MHTVKSIVGLLLAATLALPGLNASAASPAEIQKSFDTTARAGNPGFSGFSAERGKTFFSAPHGNDWSCVSCHTTSPAATGKHAKTGKEIAPLAPAANPQRFTDMAKVEKWFKRNCNDVLGRACTAQEQGDVLAYLLTVTK